MCSKCTSSWNLVGTNEATLPPRRFCPATTSTHLGARRHGTTYRFHTAAMLFRSTPGSTLVASVACAATATPATSEAMEEKETVQQHGGGMMTIGDFVLHGSIFISSAPPTRVCPWRLAQLGPPPSSLIPLLSGCSRMGRRARAR
jgi:hypothetical protein